MKLKLRCRTIFAVHTALCCFSSVEWDVKPYTLTHSLTDMLYIPILKMLHSASLSRDRNETNNELLLLRSFSNGDNILDYLHINYTRLLQEG